MTAVAGIRPMPSTVSQWWVGAMPIVLLNPLAARPSAGLGRNAAGLAVALVCGHVIGFRFYRGPLETIGFCVLVLSAGAALAFLHRPAATGRPPLPAHGLSSRRVI